MKGLGVLAAGLLVSLALAGAPAQARARCCYVPAGTVVEIALADEVSTKNERAGDAFAFRLAQPIVVGGLMVALRRHARLRRRRHRVRETGHGWQAGQARPGGALPVHSWPGHRAPGPASCPAPAGNNAMAAQAVGLTGIAFAPLGFISLAVQGGHVTFPAGTTATAKLSDAITLPPIGRAPPGAAAAVAMAAEQRRKAIMSAVRSTSSPPPAGQGQIVFFRPKSLMGTGLWFKVRENGQALGKLSNGAYFIQTAAPGLHTYTASEEPEFKDKLKLEIDPGETYFVEGGLSKGLVLSAANLSPSDRHSFDRASKDLKLASAPEANAPASDQSGGPADQSAAASAAPSDAAPTSVAPPTGTADSDLGYGWAKQNKVTDVANCPAAPSPYRAGCLDYVGAIAAASSR